MHVRAGAACEGAGGQTSAHAFWMKGCTVQCACAFACGHTLEGVCKYTCRCKKSVWISVPSFTVSRCSGFMLSQCDKVGALVLQCVNVPECQCVSMSVCVCVCMGGRAGGRAGGQVGGRARRWLGGWVRGCVGVRLCENAITAWPIVASKQDPVQRPHKDHCFLFLCEKVPV